MVLVKSLVKTLSRCQVLQFWDKLQYETHSLRPFMLWLRGLLKEIMGSHWSYFVEYGSLRRFPFLSLWPASCPHLEASDEEKRGKGLKEWAAFSNSIYLI